MVKFAMSCLLLFGVVKMKRPQQQTKIKGSVKLGCFSLLQAQLVVPPLSRLAHIAYSKCIYLKRRYLHILPPSVIHRIVFINHFPY